MNSAEKCLVIMPFGNGTDEALFYQMVYYHIILPAFAKANVGGARIDYEAVGDEPLTAAIEERLRTAPLVVADLSGNNPNVLYELGFRRAHGKPFICISRKPGDATFWPHAFLIIDYTSGDAVDRIATAINEKYPEVRVRLRSEATLTTLIEQVRLKNAFRNTFQDRLAEWRIERALDQIRLIQSNEAEFEAKTSTAYVAHLFNGIMGKLEDGEEYYTVTNIKFWSDEGVGNSPFLDSNVEAAERGVKIKRVFLIDEREWVQESRKKKIKALLTKHQEACDKVSSDKKENLTVKCLPSKDFGGDRARYGHFGLARAPKGARGADASSVVIVPRYDATDPNTPISALKFTFSSKASPLETLKYMHKFDAAFTAGDAQELSGFLKS